MWNAESVKTLRKYGPMCELSLVLQRGFFFFKETVVSGSGTKMWKAGLCYEFGLFVAQSPHLGHQLSPIET